MKTTALIEMGKDGTFGVYTPNIDATIIGDGATVAEAKADFENSVSEMIASYTENGEDIPKELQGITFVYRYDIASFLNHYKLINMSCLADIAGINHSLMRQYKKGQYISGKRVKKIQDAIHSIGRELAEIELF